MLKAGTYSAAGYVHAVEFDRIMDELCDLIMDARIIGGADQPSSIAAIQRAQALPERLEATVKKLQEWDRKGVSLSA